MSYAHQFKDQVELHVINLLGYVWLLKKFERKYDRKKVKREK